MWYVKTKYPIFSFDYDSFANGLNGVRPLKGGRQLKKISINEIRFLDQVPITNDVFYWVEGVDKVYITQNLDLTLYYIPAVLGADDQCVMADTCVAEVIEKTLTLMFGAKNGNIIQKANDQNKNLILPQQVNPDLGKQ